MDLLPLFNYTLLVPLTPQQLDARRIQLNQAGRIAWLSPASLLLLITPYIFLAPQLPASSSKGPPTPLQRFQRRASWLLSMPLSAEFGTLQTHLLGLAYTSWLLLLIFRGTGHDYMHLTKSFGHVAVSQLPWQYLLAIKSHRNELQHLLQQSHEGELNSVHRLFGRIVHLLLAAHALLYLNFFVRIGVLEKKLQDPVVRLGIAAFGAFNVLAVLSLPLVRRRGYHRLFYRSHVLLTALVLPLLYFHVPYTRMYVIQAAAAYLFNGVARSLASSPAVPVTVEVIPGTSLLRLKADGKAATHLLPWTAGQHIYLKQSHSPLSIKTPFTVVRWFDPSSDMSGTEASIELVVRNTGGPQTGWLGGQQEAKVSLLLEGPYGESKTYLPTLLQQRRKDDDAVLLVAGGVGVTYTLPVYLALLEKFRSSARITFVWFVKSRAEAAWGIDMLGIEAPRDVDVDVSVYVTTGNEVSSEKVEETSLRSLKRGIRVHPPQERAHLAKIVDAVFAQDGSAKGKVYVFACGPARLAKELREKVGEYVMRDARDVLYHEERFGLGSS